MAIRINLNIHSGDAAFDEDSAATEAARILRLMAQRIEDGLQGPFKLFDHNGNGCGSAHVEIWDDEAEA